MKQKESFLFATIVLLLVGCSNPYYKFYRGDRYERNNPPSCTYLGSISSADEIQKYLDDYSFMGESGFSSTTNDYNVNKMIAACNAVGGDAAIIVEPEYMGEINVVRTYYTYQPGQTYTVNSTSRSSGGYSGNIYGEYDRIGSYNGSYNGTTNTTTSIHSNGRIEAHPYVTTASKYAFRAVYLKKKVRTSRNYSYSNRNVNVSGCIANDERDVVPEKDLCVGAYPFGKGYVYWDSNKKQCKTFSLDNIIPYCNDNQWNHFLRGIDPYEVYANADIFLRDSVLVHMQNLYRWGRYINKREKVLLAYMNKKYGNVLLWEWISRMDNNKLFKEWTHMDEEKKESVLKNFYSQIKKSYANSYEKNWFKIKEAMAELR